MKETLCGLTVGVFFATAANAALPDSHAKESSEPQAYCVSAKAEFYEYGGGSCEPGFQVASGNCRTPDGHLLATSEDDCQKKSGTVLLPSPPKLFVNPHLPPLPQTVAPKNSN
jgi:hypothetical protein